MCLPALTNTPFKNESMTVHILFLEYVIWNESWIHDISDRNIPQSVQKWYRRSNEVMSDFKSLSRNVKSQLFST